jgi:hypothetical protein
MSDEEPKDFEAEDDGELRSLLRGALRVPEEAQKSDVLRGVQERIRKRSRGKFYADGWSTAKHPPIYTYLVTSALMLMIAIVVYVVLWPVVEPTDVINEPAPVQIVVPRPTPGPSPAPSR